MEMGTYTQYFLLQHQTESRYPFKIISELNTKYKFTYKQVAIGRKKKKNSNKKKIPSQLILKENVINLA